MPIEFDMEQGNDVDIPHLMGKCFFDFIGEISERESQLSPRGVKTYLAISKF